MQCKDIPEEPILRFLAKNPGKWHNRYFGDEFDVHHCFPPGVHWKLLLAKMRKLIERKLVSGCYCGCRGDFEITERGQAWLKERGEARSDG